MVTNLSMEYSQALSVIGMKTKPVGLASARAKPLKVSAQKGSATRELILDATEALLFSEGYSVITSQRVAEQAGLKRQLVHYYFRSTEALLLAVWRRHADKYFTTLLRALSSPQPLRSAWKCATAPAAAAISLEFMAVARHYSAIRSEIADTVERSRRIQADVFARLAKKYESVLQVNEPELIAIISAGISAILVKEQGLGITLGHDSLKNFVEHWLVKLEGPDTSQ